MMKIGFAEQDERFIKYQVECGFYSNATELVRDAVRRLREQSDQKEKLLLALELGEKDIQAGKTIPHTPNFMQESIERAREQADTGEKAVKRDVIPY